MSYVADVTVRLTLEREPNDVEAEEVAADIERRLTGVALGRVTREMKRIHCNSVSVDDWKAVS